MTEAEFNTIVKNTLHEEHGFGYKISDVGGAYAQRRPFDGIAMYSGRPLFWESKLQKGLKAFNLKELFDGTRGHQMETFDDINRYASRDCRPLLWVILCVYIPRAPRVYTVPYATLDQWYNKEGVKSIHADYLDALPYTAIYKKKINWFRPILSTAVGLSKRCCTWDADGTGQGGGSPWDEDLYTEQEIRASEYNDKQ